MQDDFGIKVLGDISEVAHAGGFVAQIYVIHKDGIVLLSREYDKDNIQIEPQLIGGFLTAINGFARTTTLNRCPCDGKHQIADIGMSCARWFINSRGEYTVSLLVMNDSPLIQSQMWDVIDNIGLRIIDTFEIMSMFSEMTSTIDLFLEQHEEFGLALDSIVFEIISEVEKIGFTSGRSIDVHMTIDDRTAPRGQP